MVNVKHGEIIDYAMPMLKMEKLLRNLHDLCLDGKYSDAGKLCPDLIAEVRVLSASLALMQAKKETK